MCLHLIDNISFHLKVKYKSEVLTFSTDCYNKPEKKLNSYQSAFIKISENDIEEHLFGITQIHLLALF